MADRSGIAWTDSTWNPVVGCRAVSEGCDGCYAAREASGRLSGHQVYAGLAAAGRFTGEVRLLPDRLDQPLRWRAPRWVFVTSMGDLWAPGVPRRFVARVFAVMALTARHRFQVLTKRPLRAAAMLSSEAFIAEVAEEATEIIATTGPSRRRCLETAGWTPQGGLAQRVWRPPWPLPNVLEGASIELDRYAGRADDVRATPATARFLSLEPLLGPLPSLDLNGIDWVIVGGESGPGARPMDPDWVRDLRDRCAERAIPFFFKQAGAVLAREWAMGDRNGQSLAGMPEEFRVRQMPVVVGDGGAESFRGIPRLSERGAVDERC